MLTVLLVVLSSLPPLVPQSPQAWRYAVTEGGQLTGTVYQKTPRGLVCAKASQLEVVYTLESVAAREGNTLHVSLKKS